MPNTIKITKQNETYLKVICEEVSQEMDIQDNFMFKSSKSAFDPRVKSGKWDGNIRLYNRKTKQLPLGLLFDLLQFLDKKGEPYQLDTELVPDDSELDVENILSIISDIIKPHSNGVPILPYEYQINSIHYALNMDRSVSLAATSSGKSLILYCLARIYQLLDELDGKHIVICVPNKLLVEQMYSDFADYANYLGNDWHVDVNCQRVNSDYLKYINKKIIITTWQSLNNAEQSVLDDIGCILVDECQGAAADVLGGICKGLTRCKFKHGFTGTIGEFECDIKAITGLLGVPKVFVTAKELIELGRATAVNVNMVRFDYNQDVCKELFEYKEKFSKPATKYKAEVDFICALQSRREAIYNLIDCVEGNTLVLFDRVEDFGKGLFEDYAKRPNAKKSLLIIGEVKDKESIRKQIGDEDNCVIFANYACVAVGWSVKKLHNCILSTSRKGSNTIIQTIGRLMRLHDSKEKAYMFDIVDNLEYHKTENESIKNNYLIHSFKRIGIYKSEGHKIEFHKFPID